MKPIYLVPILVLFFIPVLLIAMNTTKNSPTPTATSNASPTPFTSAPPANEAPEGFAVNMTPGQEIQSPMTITGTVPAGWMFEASFPVSILDRNKNVIAQGYGEPIPPDDWMSGMPVRFTTTLTFEAGLESGFIRFAKDNPSGLPENDAFYDMPVIFSE